MNVFKSLIFSGIILASTVSSYYPVNVNGVDVEQFTITTDQDGAIFEIPAVGTGTVSCKLPSKETPRPIYTTNPNPEPETSGSVYYSEAPADQQSVNSGESQVKKVIAPISEGPCEGMQYDAVVRLFEEAGFTNIEAPGYEIEYNPSIKDGEVVVCSINDNVSFQEGEEYLPDAHVKISYRIVHMPEVIAQKGDLGANVSEIQCKLQELGYLYGSVDGDFGSQTESAVKSFQKASGLDETGIVYEKDYQALMAAKAPAANTVARDNTSANTQTQTAARYTYVVNTDKHRFHYDYCSFLPTSNYGEITGTREELIAMGYEPRGRCNP